MRREQKYTDTKTFKYYNANYKNKIGADCVVRALCTAMNKSWEQVVRELTEVGIKYGYVLNDEHCYARYLKDNGWVKYNQPRKADNSRYTGKEFCTKLAIKNVNYIAHIGSHHMVAIINKKVNDIWDSTGGCIGNYWVKEG